MYYFIPYHYNNRRRLTLHTPLPLWSSGKLPLQNFTTYPVGRAFGGAPTSYVGRGNTTKYESPQSLQITPPIALVSQLFGHVTCGKTAFARFGNNIAPGVGNPSIGLPFSAISNDHSLYDVCLSFCQTLCTWKTREMCRRPGPEIQAIPEPTENGELPDILPA